MTPPCIRDRSLDACLKKHITVEYVTLDGIERLEGTLFKFGKPWRLDLLIGLLPDNSIPSVAAAAHCTSLPFAGDDGGIVRVLFEGTTVYENKQLPRPYPQFDLQNDDDWAALTNLRRDIWGDFYLYPPESREPLEW